MTPKTIDQNIKKLISMICNEPEPIFIDVIHENYAQIGGCFPAVHEKINRDGGDKIIGWQIWDHGFMVEAEFHAIWKSPSGILIDITPKPIKTDKILFLPETNKKYEGKQVDNVRLNTSENFIVDDLIILSEMIYNHLNKDDLENQHGEIRLHGKDAALYNAFIQIKKGILSMIHNGQSRNSKCFCGRDFKYKHCHGKDIVEMRKRLQ